MPDIGKPSASTIQWDATDYARNSQGQFGWAMANIGKLRLEGTEHVLDVGCGDGKVTAEIARQLPKGHVTGVDRSAAMIETALRLKQTTPLPNADFRVLDAQALPFDAEFDAVFSNSAIHWVPDSAAVVQGIARALKPGGRIFLSMGGRGTAAVVFATLKEMEDDARWTPRITNVPSPHRFLGSEEYGTWLKAAELTATRIELVPKPMRHASVAALEGWLRTTWMHYTERVPEVFRADFLKELAAGVAPKCALADDGALLKPMVNLEIEAHR